jgi:hypothetical protein
MQKRVFEIKNSHPTMRKWDNYDISSFLWIAIIGRKSRIYYDKSLEESEIEQFSMSTPITIEQFSR